MLASLALHDEGKLVKAVRECLEKPSHFSYYGDNDGLFVTWGYAFSHNRDSEVMDESNWSVITADLAERFPDDTSIEHSSHWAVGWVEQLTVRILHDGCDPSHFTPNDVTDAFKACLEWQAKLENYPVANEEDYSRREQEKADESWGYWGAGNFEALITAAIGCTESGIDEPTFEGDHDWRTELRDELDRSHGGNEIWGSWYSGEPEINQKEFDAACRTQLAGILQQPKWQWLAMQVNAEGCLPQLSALASDEARRAMRLRAAANAEGQQRL